MKMIVSNIFLYEIDLNYRINFLSVMEMMTLGDN